MAKSNSPLQSGLKIEQELDALLQHLEIREDEDQEIEGEGEKCMYALWDSNETMDNRPEGFDIIKEKYFHFGKYKRKKVSSIFQMIHGILNGV